MLILLLLSACRRPPAIAPPHPTRADAAPVQVAKNDKYLHIPRVARPPVLAQHDDDELWQRAASTGAFWQPDMKEAARPHSNARLLWDKENLYISLYAADQDISAPDARHDGPLALQDAFTVRIRADAAPDPVWAVDIQT